MTIVDLSTTRPPSFWSEGACRHLPADLFHPDRGESTSDAKAVCATCTVRVPCLEWALANHEKFGIWGGTSEQERRRIRHRIATGLPVPQLDPDHDLGPALVLPLPLNEPTREEPVVDLAAANAAVEPIAPTNGHRPVDPVTGKPTDVCVNCGKRYTPARKDQRFHSKECARAWYASHPPSENGTRQPRIRKTRAVKQDVTPAATPAAAPLPVADVQVLLGQLLAACDRWAIEADLGDIRVSVTRGCR